MALVFLLGTFCLLLAGKRYSSLAVAWALLGFIVVALSTLLGCQSWLCKV